MAKQQGFGRSLDDLQAMAVFARVVDTRSFTAAARALEITTSSVSKRVARLEERLSVRLLERNTRSLAPTEAGIAFYERCARILHEVDEAELAVTQLGGGAPRGTLRISALSALGEVHLGPLLGAFAAEYPDLRVDVDLSDRRVNLVEEGFDLALRGMPLDGAPDSSLVARRLATVRAVICGAPSYFERHGVPATIEDLANHECLHYSPLPLQREWAFKTPTGVRSIPVASRLQMNSASALRGAAIAGYGLIRTSHLVVEDAIREGVLVSVLEEFAPIEFGLFAVYPAGKQALPKVKALVDFLVRELSPRFAA